MLITGPRDGTIWGSATALRSTSLQCASIFALISSSFGHASSSSWFRDGPATVGALLDATGPVAAADGGSILARGSRFSPSISLWSGRLRAAGKPKRHRRQKNFYAKTIIGHVACLSAHSAGAPRGAGDMTLATSAARSARRAMLTLVPRSPCSGPTARDALTASNAFPRSCASSSSSRPWSTTRGVSTRVVSCGNGDFGRLGHGGDGRGHAGLGMSAETFQPMTGIPQVRHRDLIYHPSRRHLT